ncbi:hypothetical protein GJAV_G00144600 [Gymnothorax javanicus]|nr:hypothetical protein GJAV_G00144600 [Gymnothorax javanicus]
MGRNSVNSNCRYRESPINGISRMKRQETTPPAKMDNEQLVLLVKQHPEIYDRQRRNKATKAAIWQSISEKMGGIPVLACKKRWMNIRDRHTKEMRKGPYAGKSGRGNKTWKLMPLLSFLIPIKGGASTSSEVARSSDTDSVDQDDTRDFMLDSFHVKDEEDSFSLDISQPAPSNTSVAAAGKSMIRWDLKRTHGHQVECEDEADRFLTALDTMTEDELWCLSLASKLKSMSEVQKSRFQVCATRLLHEIRFSTK